MASLPLACLRGREGTCLKRSLRCVVTRSPGGTASKILYWQRTSQFHSAKLLAVLSSCALWLPQDQACITSVDHNRSYHVGLRLQRPCSSCGLHPCFTAVLVVALPRSCKSLLRFRSDLQDIYLGLQGPCKICGGRIPFSPGRTS